MNDLSTAWPPLGGWAALAIPLLYGSVALAPGARPLRRAARAAAACLALSVVAAAGLGAGGAGARVAGSFGPRPGALTAVMLSLVCFVAFFLTRFSRAYLDGDPGRERYARWLSAALAAVTALVVADDLLTIALAWAGAGLALHPLLTFYPERPRALVAAHKKFLLGRAADACLLGAVGLAAAGAGGVRLDDVLARAAAPGPLPPSLEAAALLLAVGAALKCAQLPFHGWLIQVMEAPTPVSALLHAGVVNVGGFVMMRLAPLMAKAVVAQTFLVVVGGATAAVAALVMATRVSVKVALAWSTCAQMGLMLVECGLGAYDLALLHLVGHSLYKAHAFLSSGSAVDRWRAQTLAPAGAAPGVAGGVVAVALAAGGAFAAAALSGAGPLERPEAWALGAVVGLGLAGPALRGARAGARGAATAAVGGALVVALYVAWHATAGRALPAGPGAGPPYGRALAATACFAALFGTQAALAARPDGALARALYPRLFAGLYLDELFTRLAFRLWPPRLPPAAVPGPRLPVVATIEAR